MACVKIIENQNYNIFFINLLIQDIFLLLPIIQGNGRIGWFQSENRCPTIVKSI